MMAGDNPGVLKLLAHSDGRGDGPPVVLVHGIAASLKQWEPVSRHLAAEGLRVHALDLLGHGESEKMFAPAKFHIETVYQQFLEWLTSLNLRSAPLIIGHSMGGYIALEHALRSPETLKGLILENPLYSCDQLHPLTRLAIRRRRLGSKVLKKAPEWMIRASIPYVEIKAAKISQSMRRQIAMDAQRADPEALALPETIRDLTPSLKDLRMPVLVIWGSRDLILRPAAFAKMCKQIPDVAELCLDCGHLPHHAQIDAFLEATTKFIRRLKDRS